MLIYKTSEEIAIMTRAYRHNGKYAISDGRMSFNIAVYDRKNDDGDTIKLLDAITVMLSSPQIILFSRQEDLIKVIKDNSELYNDTYDRAVKNIHKPGIIIP